MNRTPSCLTATKHSITIKNTSVIEMVTLEKKLESLSYAASHDFILCVVGNNKYIFRDNKYDFILLMQNKKMLTDQRIKEILLEYMI